MFLGISVNKSASGVCRWASDATINCPPGTLVSVVPFKKPDNVNNRLTITAVATGSGQTASPMVQSFHFYGHWNPRTKITAGDGVVKLSWTAAGTVNSSAAINGYNVQYRLLVDTGDWVNASGVLGESTTSYDLEGLSNGVTYEVRVAARNNAGDSGDSTHWWGPWSYDTVTPQAADIGGG